MNKNICILGAGGHAKVIIEIAELLNLNINGVFDHNLLAEQVLQYKVNHDFKTIDDSDSIFFALGNNEKRKENAANFNNQSINLIHPSAIISKSVSMGEGNAVMAGSVINSSVKIGNHCIINTSSSIDHDCEIEDFVHISPSAALAGNVKILEGAQVGIGACVRQNITIGRWSIVGAGAVVLKDVPDNSTVIGNPAKIYKKN